MEQEKQGSLRSPPKTFSLSEGKRRIILCALFLLFFAYLLLFLFPPIYSFDFWWHLKTGELVWSQEDFFTKDPFSHTRQGVPWVNHEWLFEVLLFLLYKAGGLGSLRLIRTLILFAAMVFLFWKIWREGGGKTGGACGAVVLLLMLALMARGRMTVRPDVITIFFFISGFLLFLAHPERIAFKPLIFFLPVIVFWANLHSAVLAFPLFFTALFAGEVIETRLRKGLKLSSPSEGRQGRVLHLFLMLLLVWAAAFCTPQGPGIILFSQETGKISATYTSEWKPLSHFIDDPNARIVVKAVFAALAVLVLTLVHAGRRGVSSLLSNWSLSSLFSSAGAFVLAFRAFRFSWLLLVPLYFCAIYWGKWAKRREFRGAFGLFLAIGIVLASGVIFSDPKWIRRNLGHLNQNVIEEQFPIPLTGMLKDTGLEGRMYNPLKWGGYFIHALYPQYLIFVDGRNDVYGEEILLVNAAINSRDRFTDEAKEAILEPFEIDFLIGDRPQFFRTIEVRSRWVLIFSNYNSSCYLRRGKHYEKNIERVAAFYLSLGVPFDSRFGFEEDRVFQEAPRFWRAINEPVAEQLEGIEREITGFDDTERAHRAGEKKVALLFRNFLFLESLKEADQCLEKWNGCRMCSKTKLPILRELGRDRLARGDFESAVQALHSASQLFPKDRSVWRLLAEGYRKTKKGRAALDAMERALNLSPGDGEIRKQYDEIREEIRGKK